MWNKDFDTDNVVVHLLDMPASVREAVTPNPDGTYTIFINARLSHNGRLSALEHAMKHIKQDDFYKNDVQKIEHSIRRDYDDNKKK